MIQTFVPCLLLFLSSTTHIAHASHTPTTLHIARRGLAPPPAKIGPTSQPSNVTSPPRLSNTTSPNSTVSPTEAFLHSLSNPCVGLPLTNETWKKFDLDNYLHSYPNGNSVSLQDYAFSHHAQNFICGIGEGCHAGQLCNPVTAPDWYVLYAAQEWNSLQNSIYTAIGFAVSMVQATAAALVTDLFEPEHRSILFHLQDLFVLLSGVAFAVALAALLLTPGSGLVIASTVAGALFAGTSSALMGVNLIRSWDTVPDGFTRWSNYDYYLSQWQSKVQDQLSNSTSAILQAGISTDEGIYGALKGGAFLSDIQIRSTSEVEDEIKQTSTARILADILRAQGAYVTYNTGTCHGKGPGGAWAGDNVLSYCKDGVMMNIVKAKKNKTGNKWYNANLIAKKYGFTTEYLVTQSWECQKKYKGFNYDPYRNGSLPLDINSECIINFAVCDLTDPYIKHAISKGQTTTRACRVVGKLPI
ncbi:hypothetical protein CROQUDRAFT_719923 [Cronartium quercuum f. sp. fusiforme G11]|uniref:DUF7872 domain-containing protein n=1 Tax=Cronartium quercuum f. sp. fusiforme G11 TaxID=708437 RepID=A0A9P6NPV7_9BASI|nr:hypothetical protein CROQUDRAFT_719923 [Cronartium quercuum f. sp. fusiforme G11]